MAPKDKAIEARHQTTHKLEVMEHYWGAWATILAQTLGKRRFCPAHLWMIDTHAGSGRHLSEHDPDGQVPGTPVLAALAARAAQRRFSGVNVHVRATDTNLEIAKSLAARLEWLKGAPPDGVDASIARIDWVEAVAPIQVEIARSDHPHAGQRGATDHLHRSLWFIDPFGIEGLNHDVIEAFPPGSEVIVNLDLIAIRRHAARAEAGDYLIEFLLDSVYGGGMWRNLAARKDALLMYGEAYAKSFPASRWTIRRSHPLRATGSQYRSLVHLATTPTAERAFERAVRAALIRGTPAAGRKLTKVEKDKEAARLHDRFRGLTLTTREMRSMVSIWDLGQLRWICNTADQQGLGAWNDKTATMTWHEERLPELTFGL